MKRSLRVLALLALVLISSTTAPAQDGLRLTGSGATFPFPLYSAWFKSFSQKHRGMTVDYQGKGSGAGIQDLINRTVDFAASDAAMTDEQISKVPGGVQLLPMTAGEIVLAYNLPGSPKKSQAAARRLHGDLSRKDHEVERPQAESGQLLARGNEGVAARIKLSEGAIGYVEYHFARRLGLPMAHLQNRAGRFVEPTEASGQTALARNATKMPPNRRLFLPDPDGVDAYPIVTFSWLLLQERYADAQKTAILRQFLAWSLTDGQRLSRELGYIPLPAEVASISLAAVDRVE